MPERQVVGVVNLRDFRRTLQQMDPDAQKDLRGRLKRIAEIAARAIIAVVPVDPSPKRTGVAQHWRDKISAGSSGSRAYVTWGRDTVPYAPWIEFGGRIVQQERDRVLEREFIKGGRYVWPTAQAQDAELEREARRTLDEIARKHGF